MIEASLESFISGSMAVVSMNIALTFTCITRMKFSPEICCIGERGPRIEALCSRPSMRPNSFSRVAASSSNWCGWAVSRLNGITAGCGWPAASMAS
ncbi:hypothetical protein PAERUG_E16_London_17_VIM_2_04_14_00563 [Pseudomonas aeruginosa]|nr:hypothetical protein PAERUG_E16_London_17_VIM_2_04_14_00563 [Pseudomonas aeruginosa]